MRTWITVAGETRLVVGSKSVHEIQGRRSSLCSIAGEQMIFVDGAPLRSGVRAGIRQGKGCGEKRVRLWTKSVVT